MKPFSTVYNEPFNLSDITTWWAHYMWYGNYFTLRRNATHQRVLPAGCQRIKDTLCILDNATLKKNVYIYICVITIVGMSNTYHLFII